MVDDGTIPMCFSDVGGKENGSDWKRKALEEQIAESETRLAAAEKEVQNLRARCFELKETLNSTSPIMDVLPLDILTEIFAVACEKPSTSFDYGSLPEQFLIGAVCQAWRRIAWSTPRLWSCIHISFSRNRFSAQEGLFREWMGRTANCSLRLYLTVSYSRVLEWEPPEDFFCMLLKTCHRWTSFNYTFPSTSFPEALEYGYSHTFPLLDTLTVQRGELRARALYGVGDAWDFNSTPRLRDLTVGGHQALYLGLDWSSLTHVSATLELRGCIHLLTFPLHSLRKLSLSILSSLWHFALKFDRPVQRQPRLTSLLVEGGATSVGALLRLMTLPTLKELNIDIYDGSRNYPWIGIVTDLARRSAFPLTDFTLKQATTSDESQILDMLSEMPSIESLELDCSDICIFSLSDHTMNQLNPALQQSHYNRTGFLPSLRTFKYRGNVGFSLECLEEMIRRRLLVSQAQHTSPHTDPIANAFHVDIIYRNISWRENGNPNDLQNFYMAMAPLQSKGVLFKLEWAENDDDDC